MRSILLAVLAVCLLPTAVLAADTVTVPWGDWAVAAVDTAVPLILTGIGVVWTWFVAPNMPAWLKAAYGEKLQHNFEALANRAVLSAVAQVKGAALGQRLEIPVSNEVLRTAIQYAVDQAPMLVSWATGGDPSKLVKMILARMTEYDLLEADFNLGDYLKNVIAR
ncbi:hypothetical protein [Methyloceanibacter caenitepidi]|uniref:Uncharacterized protein n=1 Tax=Methyloceanibacter caenitepidi TaxID=1384459 RepID=A0A0A8K4J7_9HYPH|nr:hypothetical protein [Methyloceanibacter caenitepidi]BAQ16899.1 hypothetical protein GL4_1443 [Methyloceanibacter caenitepidi]